MKEVLVKRVEVLDLGWKFGLQGLEGTMLLRAPATACGATSIAGLENRRVWCIGRKGGLGCVRAMRGEAKSNSKPLTGVIFEPFTEVQKELVQLSKASTQSIARQRFDVSCESALNEQINVEYNVSYIYHALFAYFDRDNVGLPGFAKYFKEASDEERKHAEILMKYQNTRGGRVKLQSILMPVMEFDHPEKGDALYAMELALSLEKLTNEKLLSLHNAAQQCNDAQMTDFIEGNFLAEQVEAIKQVSEYVAQLRRVGKGYGVWHFDQMLLKGAAVADGAVAA